MKKFIITLLGVLFLSATMNAAATEEEVTEDATEEATTEEATTEVTEEVSPEEQAATEAEEINNSKTYCVELPGYDVRNSVWTKRDNHIGARWKYQLTDGTVHTVRGNWKGQDVPDQYLHDIDHIYYSRGDRPICINFARLSRDVHPKLLDTLWLDVKWGKDCPKVTAESSEKQTMITKSKDNIRPWKCTRS